MDSYLPSKIQFNHLLCQKLPIFSWLYELLELWEPPTPCVLFLTNYLSYTVILLIGMCTTCGRLKNVPHILIPWNLWIRSFNGEGDFVDVTKLRILSWRNNPGLSGWAQCINKGSYEREAGVSHTQKVTWQQTQRNTETDWKIPCCWLRSWRLRPPAKECRQAPGAGEGKKMASPLEPPEGMWPQRPILGTSDLQTLRTSVL